MKRAKRQTNVAMLRRLMEFSKNGALMQAFVLTAIDKYAQQCMQAGAEKLDTPLVSGRAWVACAQEAQQTVAAHLGAQS